MAEDGWHEARLIPTSGISGQLEAERRATSALLAVAGAVREFGTAIVKPLGAPAGHLDCYIEVPFKLGERTVIPDGLLQTTRAGKTWTALVEVKTSDACLEREQVEAYLDVAREQGFNVVLTISNQMQSAPGVHPVEVDRRKVKKVELFHLSWAEVLTLAVQQRIHRGVSDPDQAWILGELIRYLEHPKSGALDFNDMSQHWVPVRESLVAGTLRPNDKGLSEVIGRWEQLLRFAALRLGRELGTEVQVALSRRELAEPQLRIQDQTTSLVTRGVLDGSLRIPGTIGLLTVAADLRAGTVTTSVDIDAPREGRPTTRVNWLVRQLKDAPDGLRLEAWVTNARTSTSELLRVVRENPPALVEDPNKELRSFRVSAVSTLGTKRGTGRGSFIDSVLAATDGFYASVLQNLRPWVPKAPQLPQGQQTAAEAEGLDLSVNPSDLIDPPTDETATANRREDPRDGTADNDTYELKANNETTADLDPTPTAPTALLEWDQALDKLERERDLSLEVSPDGPSESEPPAGPPTSALAEHSSRDTEPPSTRTAEDTADNLLTD